MNLLATKEEINDMKKELKDRFGALPLPLKELFKLIEIKIKALKAGIRKIKQEGTKYQVEWLSGKRATKITLDNLFVSNN